MLRLPMMDWTPLFPRSPNPLPGIRHRTPPALSWLHSPGHQTWDSPYQTWDSSTPTASDTWWPSLETCWGLVHLTHPPPHQYWNVTATKEHTVGKRVVCILPEYFLLVPVFRKASCEIMIVNWLAQCLSQFLVKYSFQSNYINTISFTKPWSLSLMLWQHIFVYCDRTVGLYLRPRILHTG